MIRMLCMLKGISPREQKKKVEGNHKIYYYRKDIKFLLRDPIVQKFREIRAHRKKVKKAFAKKNKDLADRLLNQKPTYKLDRIILERYPTFIDALRDLDNCLNMVHLFAALPAVKHVQVQCIHKCRRLSHEWQAYISRTHKLRKTFLSVKGIYYQVEIEGQKITWLTPHALQQVLTDDIDYNIMLTFLEFYKALLSFVNFKLYHSINVNYPPILDPRLEALGAELYATCRYISADKPKTLNHMIEEINRIEDEDQETKKCKKLFKSLKIFLSREAPIESLLFVIHAFGGMVSWEGDGSPFKESDQDITHQIVDRPIQSHIFLSREYVQPQWIYDCINARKILSTEEYLVGRVPPPHLSPFVDNDNRLSEGIVDLTEGLFDLTEDDELAEKKQKLSMILKQYQEELNMEIEGITYSASNKNPENLAEEIKDNKFSVLEQIEDAGNLSKVSMSRKKQKLYNPKREWKVFLFLIDTVI